MGKIMVQMTMALGALALAAQAAGAEGGRNCAPRPVVLDRLGEDYGETRQSIGLSGQGAVIEVFASPETGSWTIIVTRPDGITCLVAAGEAFEAMAGMVPPPGLDA